MQLSTPGFPTGLAHDAMWVVRKTTLPEQAYVLNFTDRLCKTPTRAKQAQNPVPLACGKTAYTDGLLSGQVGSVLSWAGLPVSGSATRWNLGAFIRLGSGFQHP